MSQEPTCARCGQPLNLEQSRGFVLVRNGQNAGSYHEDCVPERPRDITRECFAIEVPDTMPPQTLPTAEEVSAALQEIAARAAGNPARAVMFGAGALLGGQMDTYRAGLLGGEVPESGEDRPL